MVEGAPNVEIYTLSDGTKMPAVGLGTFKEMEKDSLKNAILKNGYRHIDTAKVYDNEEVIGDVLQEVMKEGIKREDLYIVTKVWGNQLDDPEKAIKESLAKLKLDYVDLYLIHWPSHYWHVKEPMHVIWPRMEALVEKKLTRSIGVSNFNLQILSDMLCYAKIPPVCNQIELNPVLAQTELVRFMKDHKIVPVAYMPIVRAGGEQYAKKTPDLGKDETMLKIAERYKKSPF